MRERIKDSIGQITTGILGVIVAALASATLPEPFRSLALLAAAIWLTAIYWIFQKPKSGEVLEKVKYLDALHDHNPPLISESEYFWRMNRVVMLDASSSKNLAQGCSKARFKSSPRKDPVFPKEGRRSIYTSLLYMVGGLVLPIILGFSLALSQTDILPNLIDTISCSIAFRISMIIVVLTCDFLLTRSILSPTIEDVGTLISSNLFFSGVGYAAASLHFGVTRLNLLLSLFSMSLYGTTLSAYLPVRYSIGRNIRRNLELLTLVLAACFYYAGVYISSFILVEEIELTGDISLLLVVLMAATGIGCLRFIDLQWDLVLDITLDSYGKVARERIVIEAMDDFAEKIAIIRDSVIGLLPSTILFSFIIGICSVINC